ncbi:MAG: hypothetical protein J1F35_03425 [Erysipelotrichales bacterium]|nr:hypothetical protein [Erysipelotrichales bacterium]
MPRIKVVLNKTNTQKLNKFFKWAQENWPNVDNTELSEFLIEKIKNEIKNLMKDCSEKMIIEVWIEKLKKSRIPLDIKDFKENIIENLKIAVRTKLAGIYTNKSFDNNIDIYFNEVKREYILHPQSESDELEFLPENRDVFIKNNLKLVVNCAKRYQNLGLPFEDLIQAGNEGLLAAFDNFKTDRANLRNAIIEDIKNEEIENFTYEESERIVKHRFIYGKLLDQTLKKLPQTGFESKQEFINWAKLNIKGAVFASVAFQWIRSAIIMEITKSGNVIKMPKKSKTDDDEKGSNIAKIIRLDSINPYTDDNYSDADLSIIANEEFIIEDQAIEKVEKQQTLRPVIEEMLSCLDLLDRKVIKRKYGIGYPYAMTINEISEAESISVGQVKRILRDSMLVLQQNLNDNQKRMLAEIL